MLTSFLKASIRSVVFSSEKNRGNFRFISSFGRKIWEWRRQRLQNSHIKKEWITESFLPVDFISDVICCLFQPQRANPTAELFLQAHGYKLSWKYRGWGWEKPFLWRVFFFWNGYFMGWVGGCCGYLKGRQGKSLMQLFFSRKIVLWSTPCTSTWVCYQPSSSL